MKLIQKGNSKLHNMYMFNLPATHAICNRICPGCYAAREQTRFPAILTARESRYTASIAPTFASTIISEINSLRTKPLYFRIHASGEFYSQAYIDSWYTIASAFPSITFYAYTKRLAHFDFSSLSSLPNFVLINSLHFRGLNYGPASSAPADAFICPSHSGATCGASCVYCMTKTAQTDSVWFIKH